MNKKLLQFAAIVLILALIAGCKPSIVETLPTSTNTPSPTYTPTPTFTPSPTPTATPKLPVQLQTPVPSSNVVISPDNAAAIVQLSQWGKGIPTSIALSPDGSTLLVATKLGLFFYDTTSMREVNSTEGSPAYNIQLSSDGKWLAFFWYQGTDAQGFIQKGFQVWDIENNTSSYITTNEGASYAFSPDSKMLAVHSFGTGKSEVKLLNVGTWEEIKTLTSQQEWIRKIAFSPDGNQLAVTGSSSVEFFDVSTGRIRNAWWAGKLSYASGLSFSPDGKILAFYPDGYWMKVSEFRQYPSGKVITALQGATSIDFSPVNNIGALGYGDGRIDILDLTTNQVVQTLTGHTAVVEQITYSGDGRFLASLSVDGTVKFWDVATGLVLHTFEGFYPYPYTFDISPDSSKLVTLMDDGWVGFAMVKLLDIKTSQEMYSLEAPSGGTSSSMSDNILFSPDGSIFAVQAGLGFKFIATSSGQEFCPQNISSIFGFTLSHDGKLYGVVEENFPGRTAILDIETCQEVSNFDYLGVGSNTKRGGVRINQDNNILVTDGNRGLILWAITQNELVKICDLSGYFLDLSSDGKNVVVVDQSNIKIIDTSNCQEIKSFLGNFTWARATLSPDGKILATGHADGTIQLWNMESGLLINAFKAHLSIKSEMSYGNPWPEEGISDIKFSPDGALLVSSASDGTIRLWGVKP